MSTRTLLIVGALAAVGVGFIMYRKNKSAAAAADDNPAVDANAANYALPPDVGAQVDNTGGVNFPNGIPSNTNVTTNQGAAVGLPMNEAVQ